MATTSTDQFARPDRRTARCSVGIPILAVAAPVAAIVLAWTAFAMVFSLAGGTPPTGAEQRTAGHLALAACAVAVGGPGLGFLLAVRAESRVGRWTFVVMGVVGLVFAGLVAVGFGVPARLADAPAPAPSSTRSVCQDLSGGDTRCPGG